MAEGGGTLASILVRISADATSFLEELSRSTKAAREFAEAGAILAGGGAAIVGSLTAMAEKAAGFGSEIYLAEQRTGVTSETLSGLKLAAESVGGSLDSVTMGLRKLATDAESAATGNKKMNELFDRLGVSAVDASGHVKDMNVLLPQVADALSHVQNNTDLAADAQALFGKGGAALIPIFKDGAAGLTAYSDKATALGVSVTDSQAAQSRAFSVAQEDAEKAISGIVMAIGQQFLPALTDLADNVTEHLKGIRQWVTDYPEVTDLVMNLGLALAGGGGLLLAIAGVTAGIGLMGSALGAAAGSLTVATGGISVLVALLYTFHDQIWSVEAEIMSGLVGALGTAAGKVAELAGAVGLTALHDKLEAVKFSLEGSAMDWKASADNWAAQSSGVQQLHGSLGPLKTDLDNVAEAHTKLTKEQKKFQDGVDSIVSSLDGESKKGKELAAAVEILTGKHVDQQMIINKLGPDIIKYVATLTTVPPALADIVLKMKDLDDAHQHFQDVIRQVTEANKEDLAKQVDAINGVGTALDNLNEGALHRISEHSIATDLPFLDPVVLHAADVNWNEINTTIAAQEPAIKASKNAFEQWFGGLNISLADFKKSTGAAFDDVFIKGQSVFSSLGALLEGGALSLGRAIFVDITSTLEKKLYDESMAGGLASKLGGAMSGLLGGGGGGASGLPGLGISMASAGGLLGATSASASAAAVAAGAAPGTVVAGSGVLGSLGPLLTNPWTAVIAGGIVGVVELFRVFGDQTHSHADDLVQHLQNPFAAAVEGVLGAERSAADAGQLTADQADAATTQVSTLWTVMQANLDDFASKNSKNAVVAKQAYATLEPYMTAVFSEMNTRAKGLHDAAGDAADATKAATKATTDMAKETAFATTKTTDATAALASLGTTIVDFAHSMSAATPAIEALTRAIQAMGTMAVTRTTAATDATYPEKHAPTKIILPTDAVIPPTVGGGSQTYGYQDAAYAKAIAALQTDWQSAFGPTALPHMASGTDYVPRDMPAFLHQGERVIPASQNGGGDVVNNFNIYAWDASGLDRIVRDEVIPRIEKAQALNSQRSRSTIQTLAPLSPRRVIAK